MKDIQEAIDIAKDRCWDDFLVMTLIAEFVAKNGAGARGLADHFREAASQEDAMYFEDEEV